MNPVLQTPRFLLYELQPEDLDFVAGMLAHPEVTLYYERSFDRADAQVWLEAERLRMVAKRSYASTGAMAEGSHLQHGAPGSRRTPPTQRSTGPAAK